MNKKYYFAADVHLGLPLNDPKKREERFVNWLDRAAQDAAEIFLLGDIFDFWCEYKKVVPKGFVRTLGKLSEITDKGIPVHFFPGNHDLWTFGYLASEVGLTVHHNDLEITLAEKNFYLAHGDNTGKLHRGFRIMRYIFAHRFFQRLFASIHPRWGLAFAHKWSRHSRLSKSIALPFQGDKEQLYNFAKDYSQTHKIDYYIFGHRHISIDIAVSEHARLIILGDWLHGGEYAVFADDGKLEIKRQET